MTWPREGMLVGVMDYFLLSTANDRLVDMISKFYLAVKSHLRNFHHEKLLSSDDEMKNFKAMLRVSTFAYMFFLWLKNTAE